MAVTEVDLSSVMRVDEDHAKAALETGRVAERLAGLKDTSGAFTGFLDSGKTGLTFPLTVPMVTHLIYGGRKYTPTQFMDYCRNEIFRRGSRPHLRTRSPRWRAGTRRTKKLARATR